MERLFRHKTPYGIVSETYNIDKKVIRNFTFYSNHKHGPLTVSQVAEIIEAVDDNIAEYYEQGKEPCNLAIELMRLQTQLFIRQGY